MESNKENLPQSAKPAIPLAQVKKEIYAFINDDTRAKANQKLESAILSALTFVQKEFSMHQYGHSYNDTFRKTHKPVFVSLPVPKKTDELVLRKTVAKYEEFESAAEKFLRSPTLSSQPIVYVHEIPRHKSEVLWFDDPSTLFCFVRARGYTTFDENDNTPIAVIPTSKTIPVTDKTRITDPSKKNASKTFRYGFVNTSPLPDEFYPQGNCKDRRTTTVALTRMGYNTVLYGNKLSGKEGHLFAKHLQLIPFIKDDPESDTPHINKKLITYLPYLLLALSMNIYYASNKMTTDWKLDNLTPQEIRKVKNCFYFRSTIASQFSKAWLQYFALLINTLRIKGSRMEAHSGILGEFGTHLKSISPADNLNLLMDSLPSNVVDETFKPVLFPSHHLLSLEPTNLEFDDDNPPWDYDDPHVKLIPKEQQLYLSPFTE